MKFSVIAVFVCGVIYGVSTATVKPIEKENNTSSEESSKEAIPKNGLYTDECIQKIEVPEEDVKKLKGKDIANASEKVQCYLNCVLEKDEIVQNGIFNDDVMYDRLQNVTALNEDEAIKILNICKVIEGDDKCDISYRLSKCFIEHKANLILWRIATVIE